MHLIDLHSYNLTVLTLSVRGCPPYAKKQLCTLAFSSPFKPKNDFSHIKFGRS